MNDSKRIEQELVRCAESMLSVEPGSIDPQSPLHTLGLDSVRLVELFVFIERQYGLDLISAGLNREDMETLAALAQTVEKKRSP